MKVRMNVSISGTRDGVEWPKRGGEIVLPDGEGADMCARGLATPVVEERVEKRPAARKAEKRG